MRLRVYTHAVESADGPVATMLGQILDEEDHEDAPELAVIEPASILSSHDVQRIGVPSSSSMATLGITIRRSSLIAGSSPRARSS
ncbi:MAG: hypothetical protein ACYCVN_13935 [Acidimicrobiales bacterium]